jgi:two-component system, cell cycle response regulator DivK
MRKRILVVEDQEDSRQIVRDLLTANDYEMTEAKNGEEALAAAAKERPDLILMDIQLPVMDGYEATRRIKADPSLSSIPIIAVTSYALSGDEEKARAAGCNDFVQPASTSRENSRVFAIGLRPRNSPRMRCSSAGPLCWLLAHSVALNPSCRSLLIEVKRTAMLRRGNACNDPNRAVSIPRQSRGL